jgi:septum site-determining protein MinC
MAQAQVMKSAGQAAAKVVDVFEFKSATLSLLALVLKSPDLTALSAELHERLDETPELFNQDPLLIDLTQLMRPEDALPAVPELPETALPVLAEPLAPQATATATPATTAFSLVTADPDAAAGIDLTTVSQLMRSHRMQPVAVLGANAAERAQALALGLALAPPQYEPTAQQAALRKERRIAPQPVIEVIKEVIREVVVPAEAVKTMIIDKPLRSGQRVYAKGCDLVVLALVSHGAEVIADGSIHVYAPLRGKAIAGARGDTEARIFAVHMEPELISIAGIYRTSENPLPEEVQGKPSQIRLDGEKLVMEALKY